MLRKDINYSERRKLIDGYESKVICFLDIIGISKFIEKNKDKSEKICEIYRLIERLVCIKLPQDWLNGNYYKNKITFSSLSDSIIISFSVSEIAILLPYIIRFASSFQSILLSHGLPVRGFITLGKIHHHSNSQIIFGHGLVKAYKYEKDCVFSPRVVIDSKLIKKFTNYSVGRFEKHIEELKQEKYLEDIMTFFTQREFPSIPNNVQPSIKLLLDIHKDMFQGSIMIDTVHNDIYKNELKCLDNEEKTITIMFNNYRKDLFKELKKKGGFKFGSTSVDKIINSKIEQSSDIPEHLLKWQYLQAQYNLFTPNNS